MPKGTENPVFLMSGDLKFYCLQFKNPVGIPKTLLFFSSGDESSMYFSNGDVISAYFSHRGAPGTNFGPFFPVGRGSHRVCDTGVYQYAPINPFVLITSSMSPKNSGKPL